MKYNKLGRGLNRRRGCELSEALCAGWTMSGGSVVSPKEGSHREKITVLHRFHFTSALKRMAVTVKVSPCANSVC